MCRCSVGCEYGTIIRLEDYGGVRFGTLKFRLTGGGGGGGGCSQQ